MEQKNKTLKERILERILPTMRKEREAQAKAKEAKIKLSINLEKNRKYKLKPNHGEWTEEQYDKGEE